MQERSCQTTGNHTRSIIVGLDVIVKGGIAVAKMSLGIHLVEDRCVINSDQVKRMGYV